jgi:pyruvate/2-oxoacid:ferredoxin oxidoreductase beta subunit/Pyruvate/2-oxoacid:ferredoxin oxidoreductase gamma subunit
MSEIAILRPDAKLPYCKGCGHGVVLRALEKALDSLGLAPRDICIVTDIGCVGLADELFEGPHTVHTTHGRSAAFASGISLADAVLGPGRLKTVVLMGDGGATIGISHLIHGAALNPDVTVIVHDNFLFGMTGGQHSAFSPTGFVTATTRDGNAVPPLDLAGLMKAAGAPFVARKVAGDRDLAETIARAVAVPGFAVVEVLELCTAYGVRWNALTGAALREKAEAEGWELGVLRDDTRLGFAQSWKERRAAAAPAATPAATEASYRAALDREVGIVLAGSAGEHVQTAASLLARAALKCGLRATQKNDNPVTQGTGFSLSEIVLSPDPIEYTGIEKPFALLAASADGVRELARAGHFERAAPTTLTLADEGLELPVLPGTVRRLPFRREKGGKGASLAAVGRLIEETGILPREALEDAIREKGLPTG